MVKKLKRLIYNLVDKPLPEEKMVVIISHPHGTPKHISVGSLVDKYEHENIFTQQFYNTPTCPGTSGAPVLIFGYKGWYSGFNHSGTNIDSKVNYSTIGFDHLSHPGNESPVIQSHREDMTAIVNESMSLGPQTFGSIIDNDVWSDLTVSSNDSQNAIGHRETFERNDVTCELCLQKDFRDCFKNPDHELFINVANFCKETLPPNYQELYDVILCLCDSTVKISVKNVSPYRQTKSPFPFHMSKIKQLNRFSTGFIYDIIKYTDGYKSCQCTDCHSSDKPKNIWYEMVVFTSIHVLFDDSETEGAFCTLFYDSDSGTGLNLKVSKVLKTFIEDDICIFSCYTCDADLANKIEDNCNKLARLRKNTYQKHVNMKDKNRICIIISHPHGATKQICIGEYSLHHEVGNLKQRYTYTTSTCPGSSGALVYQLKDNFLHIHTGRYKDLNICTTGFAQ